MIHIYQTIAQPATNYVDDNGDEPIQGGWPADTLLNCRCCGKRRPASACVVHCYYVGLQVYCAPGMGCKNPLEIAEKKAMEFKNRSAGQKRRWAKVKI